MFYCPLRWSVLGETCTLLYGVPRLEIAGELPMIFLINGKGSFYADCSFYIRIHKLLHYVSSIFLFFTVWFLELIWMNITPSMQGLGAGMVSVLSIANKHMTWNEYMDQMRRFIWFDCVQILTCLRWEMEGWTKANISSILVYGLFPRYYGSLCSFTAMCFA